MITPSTTLAEIASTTPALTRELERLGLDYCCDGKRSLAEAHPELVRVADVVNELRADLEPHLRKEEEVLFPMIRSLASATSQPSFHCGSIANPIAVMEHEHVAVGALLEQLRTLTNGYQAPAGTCASTRSLMEGLAELEADTHLHVHKENNHLFPAVMALDERLTASSPQRV